MSHLFERSLANGPAGPLLWLVLAQSTMLIAAAWMADKFLGSRRVLPRATLWNAVAAGLCRVGVRGYDGPATDYRQ